MPRPGLHRPVLHVLLLALVVAWLPGCSSGPQVVLDSDIPTVPDMSQRLGFDIKRRGPDLVGGVFIFIGPILDMEPMIKKVVGRFRNQGWSVIQDTWGFPRSVLRFGKGDRRVRVILDADQLEPAMSRAQYMVSMVASRDPEPGSEAGDPDPSPTDSPAEPG